MGFLGCIFYMAILGILAYPVGRIISWCDPDPEGFLFRERSWEDGGKVYEKLSIKSWQAKIPDVSKFSGNVVPKKKLEPGTTAESLRVMIRETCTAELVHDLLCFFGIPLINIWRGLGGWIMYLVYVFLGNLPFVLVQRYNRPRLKKMEKRLEQKEALAAKMAAAEDC